MATRTQSAPSIGTSAAVARGSHDDDSAVVGPTTRSRKRKHNNMAERSIETNPLVASAPSRRKRSSSTAAKRSRVKSSRVIDNRKKPPPGSKKAPPAVAGAKFAKKSTDAEDVVDKKPAAVDNCCICMCDVEPSDLALINSCDHRFCFGCIEKWAERENKCPLCKNRFNKIDRVNKTRKKGSKNSKKVKTRDQRSDIVPGAALEGLIANLNRNSGSLARIIFGGFEFGGSIHSTSSSGANSARAGFSAPRSNNGTYDDESDDEDSPMAAFMRALHGAPGASGVSMSTTVVRPMTVTARFTATTRSYARNVHDSTAGNGAENPLEIDLDDDSDEVIEID